MTKVIVAVGFVEYETPVSFTLVSTPVDVIENFAELFDVIAPAIFLSVEMIVK
jgi:hypothetical protein